MSLCAVLCQATLSPSWRRPLAHLQRSWAAEAMDIMAYVFKYISLFQKMLEKIKPSVRQTINQAPVTSTEDGITG